MYPFPQPYPTLRTCEKCGRTFRLVDFRRWFGGKRVLFSTCNACKPEIPVDADANAVDRGRINPLIAQAKQAMREARADARRRSRQQRRRVTERKRNWNAALFTPLRQELAWAQRALSLCRLGQGADLFTGARPTPAVAAAYVQWQEFFETYARVLTDAQKRAQVKLGLGRVGKLEPTPEELEITSYIFPETIGVLRQLYAQCCPIPGRKSFRTPKLLGE